MKLDQDTDYLNVDYGVKSWLLTIDHKRIAILYLVSITVMFMLGGLFAAAIESPAPPDVPVSQAWNAAGSIATTRPIMPEWIVPQYSAQKR